MSIISNEYILFVDGERVPYSYFNVTLGRVPVCNVVCQKTNGKKYELKLKDSIIFTGLGKGQDTTNMSMLTLSSNPIEKNTVLKGNSWTEATARIIIEDMCSSFKLSLDLSKSPSLIVPRFSCGKIDLFDAITMLSTTLAHHNLDCEYFFNASGHLVFGEKEKTIQSKVTIPKGAILSKGAQYITVTPQPILYNSEVNVNGRSLRVTSVVHEVSVGNRLMTRFYF